MQNAHCRCKSNLVPFESETHLFRVVLTLLSYHFFEHVLVYVGKNISSIWITLGVFGVCRSVIYVTTRGAH